MARILKIGVTVLIVLVVIGVCAWRYVASSYDGDTSWVYISRDATESSLTDSLRMSLGGSFGQKVADILRVAGVNMAVAHGAYKVVHGEKAISVARHIKHGAQTPVRVTFNNTRTIQQLADKVTGRLEMSADDFLSAVDSVAGIYGFKSDEISAAFLPDTYEFYWTAQPTAVADRLIGYRNRFWNDERRAKAAVLGLTPVQVATLASIVEEETNVSDERPIVARLYLNRIHKGMLLQADPTVKWAVGDFALRRITNAHLQVDSPYNTYKYAGLPPGPIRVVAASTLDAVLNAPKHNYLYMCASDDFSGRHKFTSDYAEHQRNAAKYRSALNRRNIR